MAAYRALGFSVIDLENDYLFVRFQSERDAEFAFTQGPWTIMGHCLIVQLWTPRFDNSKEEIESVIAWIHLLGMALHYYHKKILRMLGQIIGSIIKVDYNNESATRGKFARLTVEVALTKPLISQFFLDGKVQKVEYEGLPTICFGCGKYGHNHEACPNHAAGSVSGVKRVDINQVNIDLPVPEGSGDPPDNENPALKEDLDDDIDDSDYMKDSKDDGSISSDDDISFEDEKDMDLEHEA
ncbi:DUF4283 domain-containing protein [Citrus sinensis]|uniref:DUF4283 domain-containing protein n=1 Tax=Citrus sinensis TaxID=2711 RepID=A0ACB8JQ60_CITSI|nr:DUF4283 domain-containing protein [Citrus sinensis]